MQLVVCPVGETRWDGFDDDGRLCVYVQMLPPEHLKGSHWSGRNVCFQLNIVNEKGQEFATRSSTFDFTDSSCSAGFGDVVNFNCHDGQDFERLLIRGKAFLAPPRRSRRKEHTEMVFKKSDVPSFGSRSTLVSDGIGPPNSLIWKLHVGEYDGGLRIFIEMTSGQNAEQKSWAANDVHCTVTWPLRHAFHLRLSANPTFQEPRLNHRNVVAI